MQYLSLNNTYDGMRLSISIVPTREYKNPLYKKRLEEIVNAQDKEVKAALMSIFIKEFCHA